MLHPYPVLPCIIFQLVFSIGLLQAQQTSSPNILMISVDDLNDFIGGMGHPDAITPNLDRLISSGVLFANAQCQSPMCSPSRTAIMTGLRPSTTGIYGFISDNQIKKTNEATQKINLLHQYFKDAGYHTMGVGKIFHNHAPKGLMDESGGREPGFGPKPAQSFHWDKNGTSTDWGAFPERDDQMPDYRSAKWAIEKIQKEYNQPFSSRWVSFVLMCHGMYLKNGLTCMTRQKYTTRLIWKTIGRTCRQSPWKLTICP